MQAEKNPRYWMWKRLEEEGVYRCTLRGLLHTYEPSLEDYARAETFSIMLQEKEADMNGYININTPQTTSESDLTARKQNYLRDRSYDIRHDKQNAAMRTFGLADDPRPATATEFVERIKSGMFVIPKQHADTRAYSAFEYIEWRDPAKEKDEKGFDTWKTKFEKEWDNICDIIAIKDADTALAAIQAWEQQD